MIKSIRPNTLKAKMMDRIYMDNYDLINELTLDVYMKRPSLSFHEARTQAITEFVNETRKP